MNTTEYPILAVLNDAIDAILSGTGGAFAIPKGGTVNVSLREKAGCYRITVDLVVHPPERRVTPEGWGARRVEQYERANATLASAQTSASHSSPEKDAGGAGR